MVENTKKQFIKIRGACENNLKHLDVDIRGMSLWF